MAARENELEQSIIDHEVRLGRTQAAVAGFRAARQDRRDSQDAMAETRWFREQYISMLRSAETEQELHDLGLSDEVVREARLGDTLVEAWRRHRPPDRGIAAFGG